MTSGVENEANAEEQNSDFKIKKGQCENIGGQEICEQVSTHSYIHEVVHISLHASTSASENS